jgi:predicted transcriptional regulator
LVVKLKKLDLVVKPKILEIIKIKKIEPDFEPSMKTLSRIVKSLTEQDSGGKTQLSLDTNLNYARLAKHIVWLEKKGLAKSTIKDNKITIGLTANGRDFALILTKII